MEIKKKCRTIVEKPVSADLTLLREKYLKDLKSFDPSRLSGFLGKALKEEIVFNQGLNGFFRRLIESDDYFISIPIINTCISLLSNVNQDFLHKKNYLNLFSYYIKQGNIYAIVAAHNASFIRSIFDEITKVPGNLGL